MPFQVKNANYNALRKLNLRERMKAASDPQMGQVVIQLLSPSQIASLFPQYWIEKNPNIGGFLKALPSSISAAKQRAYEQQVQNTASGSAAGANYEAGGYRRKWQKEMDEEQQRSQITKKGQVPPPQLSPEQLSAFNALKDGDIDINDERMKWLKNAPEDIRKSVGITTIKDDKGNERFHYAAPQISEEEAKTSLSKSYAEKESAGDRQKSIIREANKLGISPKDLAAVMFYETGGRLEDPNIVNRKGVIDRRAGAASAVARGADPHFFGLIQFGTHEQIEYGIRPGMGFSEQMSAVGNYLRKKGYSRWLTENPNATEMEKRIALYSTINAGGPGKENWGKNDLRYGGSASTVVEKTQQIFGGAYYQRADKFMEGSYSAKSDPLTQNYTPQQIAAKQREMESSAEAARLGKLAAVTQPGGPVNAQGPIGGSPELSSRYVGKAFPNAKGNTECAAFAQQAGRVGHTSGWSPGTGASSGNLKPGDWIATFNGGKYTNTYGQSHTAMFNGYQRDQSGKIVGIKVLEQFNKIGSVREHTYPITGTGGEKDGSSYYQIMDRGKPASMSDTIEQTPPEPLPPPKVDDTDQIRVSKKQTERDIQVAAPAPAPESDALGIKPLTNVVQPQGPINAAGPAAPVQQETPPLSSQQETAAPAKSAAPSPTPEKYNVNVSKFVETIRGTEEFKSKAGIFGGMVPDSTIISGFNDDPRVKASGVRLDEKGVMHFTKGMTPDAKDVMSSFDTKSFMTKIEEKKKEAPTPTKVEPTKVEAPTPAKVSPKEETPTKVAAMASGGPVPVNTEQIAAYPIGGLRGDNAVVVNAHQKPLFTMNTNEDVLMDPDNNRAQVIPNKKGTTVGPAPKEGMTSGIMEDFNSTINEIRQDFASLKAAKPNPPTMTPTSPTTTESGWIEKLSHTASDPFKTPSARRVAYRAGGMETGEPHSGFHYSRGNNS